MTSHASRIRQHGFCVTPIHDILAVIGVLAVAAFVIYPRVQAHRFAQSWVDEVKTLHEAPTPTARQAMAERFETISAKSEEPGTLHLRWMVEDTQGHTRLSLRGMDERICLSVAQATLEDAPDGVFRINGTLVRADTDLAAACGDKADAVFELLATGPGAKGVDQGQ